MQYHWPSIISIQQLQNVSLVRKHLPMLLDLTFLLYQSDNVDSKSLKVLGLVQDY